MGVGDRGGGVGGVECRDVKNSGGKMRKTRRDATRRDTRLKSCKVVCGYLWVPYSLRHN